MSDVIKSIFIKRIHKYLRGGKNLDKSLTEVTSDKILWLGIKSGFLYIEFYAEFKKLRKKKVLRRSANHFIKSGLELTKSRFL